MTSLPSARALACAGILLVAWTPGPTSAQFGPGGNAPQGSTAAVASQADLLMDAFDPQAALEVLNAGLERWPDEEALRIRAAEAAVSLGFLAPSGDSSLVAYRQAEHHARAVLASDSTSMDGRYWLVVAVGRQAFHDGLRNQARQMKEAYLVSHEILEEDPAHAGAHHALGTLHTEVMRRPGLLVWMGANILRVDAMRYVSWEAAEYHHDQAVAAEPDVVLYRMRRGEYYMLRERYDEAMVDFDAALALPDAHPIDPLMKSEVRGFVRRVERARAEQESG